jgi:hypothetical protein
MRLILAGNRDADGGRPQPYHDQLGMAHLVTATVRNLDAERLEGALAQGLQ